jgi:glycosyltransferase involved in cell wall biosynthesis
MDMLLWPSKREGLGLPIVEALAYGLPVLLSNGYMMKDWIVPGEHGMICRAVAEQGPMALPEMRVDAVHLSELIASLASRRTDIKRMAENIEHDRDIWSWTWQPALLRDQIAKIIEFNDYAPPSDLSYLPEPIREFRNHRQILESS